tara:strand:- start:51685 stop:52170 length:486 start_codon:yes stop_codon:yes gene_type:complete
LIHAKPASAGKVSKCPQCQAEIQVPLPRKTNPEPPPLDVNRGSQNAPKHTIPRSDDLDDIEFLDQVSPKKENQTGEDRYLALKLLSMCFRGIAWFTGIGVVVAIVVMIIDSGLSHDSNTHSDVLWSGVQIFLGGVFSVLVQLSISEIILLFIDIEKNTRKR